MHVESTQTKELAATWLEHKIMTRLHSRLQDD